MRRRFGVLQPPPARRCRASIDGSASSSAWSRFEGLAPAPPPPTATQTARVVWPLRRVRRWLRLGCIFERRNLSTPWSRSVCVASLTWARLYPLLFCRSLECESLRRLRPDRLPLGRLIVAGTPARNSRSAAVEPRPVAVGVQDDPTLAGVGACGLRSIPTSNPTRTRRGPSSKSGRNGQRVGLAFASGASSPPGASSATNNARRHGCRSCV